MLISADYEYDNYIAGATEATKRQRMSLDIDHLINNAKRKG